MQLDSICFFEYCMTIVNRVIHRISYNQIMYMIMESCCKSFSGLCHHNAICFIHLNSFSFWKIAGNFHFFVRYLLTFKMDISVRLFCASYFHFSKIFRRECWSVYPMNEETIPTKLHPEPAHMTGRNLIGVQGNFLNGPLTTVCFSAEAQRLAPKLL